jgi:hypothetical protein
VNSLLLYCVTLGLIQPLCVLDRILKRSDIKFRSSLTPFDFRHVWSCSSTPLHTSVILAGTGRSRRRRRDIHMERLRQFVVMWSYWNRCLQTAAAVSIICCNKCVCQQILSQRRESWILRTEERLVLVSWIKGILINGRSMNWNSVWRSMFHGDKCKR